MAITMRGRITNAPSTSGFKVVHPTLRRSNGRKPGVWAGEVIRFSAPDYWVLHEEIFSAGDRMAAIGAAGGTIAAVGGGCP